MRYDVKLRVPINGFSFKPASVKQPRITNSYKRLSQILYCVAHKKDNGDWEAHINTKGLRGYEDITILPFTEKTFELKGRIDVFYHNKDKYGAWTRIIRTDLDAKLSPGNPQTYCTLCEDCVFSGYIVRVNNTLHFDMFVYQGTYKQCNDLITKFNRNKDDVNDESN